MKSKAMIPMLVGVGIGLLTLKMGWNYIEKNKLSAAASQGDTPVVVASRSRGVSAAWTAPAMRSPQRITPTRRMEAKPIPAPIATAATPQGARMPWSPVGEPF